MKKNVLCEKGDEIIRFDGTYYPKDFIFAYSPVLEKICFFYQHLSQILTVFFTDVLPEAETKLLKIVKAKSIIKTL